MFYNGWKCLNLLYLGVCFSISYWGVLKFSTMITGTIDFPLHVFWSTLIFVLLWLLDKFITLSYECAIFTLKVLVLKSILRVRFQLPSFLGMFPCFPSLTLNTFSLRVIERCRENLHTDFAASPSGILSELFSPLPSVTMAVSVSDLWLLCLVKLLFSAWTLISSQLV